MGKNWRELWDTFKYMIGWIKKPFAQWFTSLFVFCFLHVFVRVFLQLFFFRLFQFFFTFLLHFLQLFRKTGFAMEMAGDFVAGYLGCLKKICPGLSQKSVTADFVPHSKALGIPW